MMRLSGALAVAAVASGRTHTPLTSTVCSQLLTPPDPPHPSEEGEHEPVVESTEASRCAAAGVAAPDCAFFLEVLALTHTHKGASFEAAAFCETVQAVADCSQILSHVLTSTTVQDLVEAECLKRNEDQAYCNELKLSVGGNDRIEDAKLWQCYKAHEAAIAEKAHRAHAEEHAAVEEIEEAEEAAEEPASHSGEMAVAIGAMAVAGGLVTAYLKTRPRIVSLDDALMSNEGYSQVLDAYNRAYA